MRNEVVRSYRLSLGKKIRTENHPKSMSISTYVHPVGDYELI